MATASRPIADGLEVAPLKSEASFVEDISMTEKSGGEDVVAVYRGYDPEYAARIEKGLLRKVDTRLMPLVVIIYIFSYLDRNSITQARLYGFEKDTHTTGALYNTAIAIFSAGYVAMQLPATVLMTKLRPSIYLPTTVIVWAVVSGSTGATTSPAGVLIARFLLGIVEAPFYPGAVYLLSCWYTKKELGKRIAFLICGIMLSNAFAGLLSVGILEGMNHATRLAAWRWLFIIEALATLVLAAIAILFLPDYPSTTKWLSEEERIVAQARLAKDASSEALLDADKVSMWKGIKLALTDYRTFLFAGMQMTGSAAISYSHYFPTLIKELGFKSNVTSLLLTSPPYMFAFCWSLGLAYHADLKQTRSIHAATSFVMCSIGAILLITLPEDLRWPRYAFTFLVAAGSFGVYSTTYTWLSSTIIQPPVKRAAAIGFSNTVSNAAALWASYFWLDKYAPRFRESWGCSLAFMIFGLGIILTIRVVLQRSNRRFDRLAAEIDPSDDAALSRLDDDTVRAVKSGFRFII